jgi:hypothetical protein
VAVPTDIAVLMAAQRGAVRRSDPGAALEELLHLGVEPESQLAMFCAEYQVSPVSSSVSAEELMDPVSPTRQLRGVTAFVRDTYEVPTDFVCLTSAEGEGFILYELSTGAVYDVDARHVPALTRGLLQPRWVDVFAFLRWYLQ